MTLLEALIKIRDEGPYDSMFGICDSLIDRNVKPDEFKDLAVTWPKFSGDPEYPVPSSSELDSQLEYERADDEDMWNPDHPYGALRLELLNWCIEQLSTSE